ncbi:MAG TPA: HD domain-containing protein [Gemmatimonadaceae bacterium]|jgi:2-amino-4-hydroxy-6-hydroxymethyldihydropteridine diphosphokinase
MSALIFPSWARASDKRRAHIERVVNLLMQWADELDITSEERDAWRGAGLLHDALRDAPEEELRALANDASREAELLHGPAVANLLESRGDANTSMLGAIRYHTVGSPDWDRTGRALYMADFLEPGRSFAHRDRAFLAAQVPHDFDGVFRQVLRARLEYALREGYTLFPETVGLWNTVR